MPAKGLGGRRIDAKDSTWSQKSSGSCCVAAALYALNQPQAHDEHEKTA